MEHAGVGVGGPHCPERASENQYIHPTIVGSALLLLLTAPYVAQRGRPRWRKEVRTSRQSKMKTQRSLSSTL